MKEMIKRMNQFNRTKPGYVTNSLTDYLLSQGFFLSPASTKYHGNYECRRLHDLSRNKDRSL